MNKPIYKHGDKECNDHCADHCWHEVGDKIHNNIKYKRTHVYSLKVCCECEEVVKRYQWVG